MDTFERDLKRSELELEALSTSSESTGTFRSSDPGQVRSDFDAAATNSMYGFTAVPGSKAAPSARSYQPEYARSPLQHMILPEELRAQLEDYSDESESGSDTQHPHTGGAPPRETVSPFGPYESPEPAVHGVRLSTSSAGPKALSPGSSMEVAAPAPLIEPERVQKLVVAIDSALDWVRTLTENNPDYISEHDSILSILYVISNRLYQGTASRHIPLYRSLFKTVKQLTNWSQEVVSHRTHYDKKVISVTLRGFIQKLRDFNTSLGIDSDPAAIASQLNAKISAHNSNRSESDALRQALKQKLREEKLARREERANIRRMHEQLKTFKRAQKDGIEPTERLGGMVSREAIRSPPMDARQESAHDEALQNNADERSVLTGDEPQSLSESQSLSSLGAMIPRAHPERRGPGASVLSTAEHGQTSEMRSRGSSPRIATHARNAFDTSPPQNIKSESNSPSVLSSKPLPHRPFSGTEQGLIEDLNESELGTSILEDVIEMDGERPPSVTFVPRATTNTARSDRSYVNEELRDGDHLSSPRSRASLLPPPPPIQVSASQRSHRSVSLRSQRSPAPSQRSIRHVPGAVVLPPPGYEYSTMPEPFTNQHENSKTEMGVDQKGSKGDYSAEVEYDDGDDADLLAAFNRVANNRVDTHTRGDILDQRAEMHLPGSPNTSNYPHRAYQPPGATLVSQEAEEGNHDSPYLGPTRSGSPPASSAVAYRKTQSRSQKPHSRSAMSGGRSPDNFIPLTDFTDYDLDEPVDPYPVMNEHGWIKSTPMDERYTTSQEHPGVRVRMYENGEQPGILEVLSPELNPALLAVQQPQQQRQPSRPTSRASRAPRIFTAMAEHAEQERERERGQAYARSAAGGEWQGPEDSSPVHRRVASLV